MPISTDAGDEVYAVIARSDEIAVKWRPIVFDNR